jgi:cytochrome P450
MTSDPTPDRPGSTDGTGEDIHRVHEPLTDLLADGAFPHEDPFDLYAGLRHAGPLTWNAPGGFWVAARHREVTTVGADASTWCSGKGILTFEIGAEYPTPPTMMHTDPPEHTRYRSLVQPAFGRRVVRALLPTIRAAATGLVESLPLGEELDVVPALTAVLPVQVIGMVLGLPESDWDRVWAWSEATIPGTDTHNDPELRNRLRDEMAAELTRLIAAARVTPGDDVISQLVSAEIGGDRLTDDELAMFCNQLLVAGNETTRNTLSGALVAFANNPDEWTRLLDDRSLVDSACEEILRWTTPVIAFMRTATRDTTLAGVPIAAGDPVLMLYASANRDELEFGDDADQFRIDRSPNHHVAFGFGPHFCLGAALARAEITATLNALADAGVTRFELTGAVGHSPSTIIAGITTAPMVVHVD